MKVWKIYKIVNLINNKIYIGQTILDGIQFDNYLGSGTSISKAVKKYGKQNFIKEVLLECDCVEDANEAEIFYIKEFDSINNGYNIMPGGNMVDFPIEIQFYKSSKAGKIAMSLLTNQQRIDKARNAANNYWNKLSKNEKSEISKNNYNKSIVNLGEDKLFEIKSNNWKNLSEERKSNVIDKMNSGFKKFYNNLTPEQKRQRAIKANKMRNLKYA